MNEPSPSEWLASIADIFEALDLEWTIVGALAANRYRTTPRFTTDLDAIRSILEANPALDHDYLDYWTNAWDVTDRWVVFRPDR